MALDASYHKEQHYIWLYGLELGICTVSEIQGLLLTRGVGAYPQQIPSLCHWMHLIIRNNNIYGLGLGISTVFEICLLLTGRGGNLNSF